LIVYLRLLRIKAAAMTTIMAMTAAIATYIVAGSVLVGGGAMLGEGEVVEGADVVGVMVGVDVGGAVTTGVDFGWADGDAAATTFMWVTEADGKYDSEPSNDAVTVYTPGTGGVHGIA